MHAIQCGWSWWGRKWRVRQGPSGAGWRLLWNQTAEWGGPARLGLAQPRPEHGPSQGGVSGSSPRGCGTIIAGDSGHRGAWLGGQEELRGQLRPARVITGQCRELPRCLHSTPSPQPPLPAQPPSRALSLGGGRGRGQASQPPRGQLRAPGPVVVDHIPGCKQPS